MSEKIIDKFDNLAEACVWGHEIKVADWWTNDHWSIPDSFIRRHKEIVEQIQQVQLTSEEDVASWTLTQSGKFTIQSCYNQLQDVYPKVRWNNIVWDNHVFPMHGFILWQAILGRLKTKDWLSTKGV